MIKRVIFAFPGDLATQTGGYIYDRRMIAGLQALGWQVELLSLGDGFPYPSSQTRAHALQCLASIKPRSLVVIDGLALGVCPEAVAACAQHNVVVGLIHHPLACEAGISIEQATEFHQTETEALRYAKAVITTGPATAADLIKRFEVDPAAVDVVCPGTERASFSKGSQSDLVHILSVGAVTPRKGFDILLAALRPLAQLPWTLSIAGDLTRDKLAPLKLAEDISACGFEERVHVLGIVDETQLESLYQTADVFALASLFEGYGMAYAEALARGLPIIGTTGGAIPDTVPSDAGLLVPPGDVKSLTQALRQIIQDRDLRAQLSVGARQAAALQPTWQESAERFGEILLRQAMWMR